MFGFGAIRATHRGPAVFAGAIRIGSDDVFAVPDITTAKIEKDLFSQPFEPWHIPQIRTRQRFPKVEVKTVKIAFFP